MAKPQFNLIFKHLEIHRILHKNMFKMRDIYIYMI